MEVHKRIKARKILLWFCYEYCFYSNMLNDDFVIKNILEYLSTFEKSVDFMKYKKLLKYAISNKKNSDTDDELTYIIKFFYDKWSFDDIDLEYLFMLWKNIKNNYEKIKELVNKYTKTFDFDNMDTIDQAIFLLWYAEYIEIWTPKNILLNELIELANRYWDEKSYKLVNWIMHKILSE